MENAALEIRKTGESFWEVFHKPTGLSIDKFPPSTSYGRNKRKEVKAFMEYMLNAFPWHEWTERENAPAWADKAFQYRNAYKHA